MLVATMTFDDEDPDVHAHLTQYAHGLERDDPREAARVLGVLADALREYAEQVATVAAKMTDRLDHQDAARAQLGRDQAPTW